MNLGLRAKLIGSIALFMVVLAVFSILYFPWKQSRVASSSLRDRARDVGVSLGVILAPDIGDRTALQDAIHRFATQTSTSTDLRYINLVQPDGLPLAAWHRQGVDPESVNLSVLDEKLSSSWHEDSQYLHQSTAVVDRNGKTRATLHLGFSLESVRDVYTAGRIEVAVFAGLILVIGIFVAWFVGGSLTTPILEVAKELQEVSTALASAARDQEASSAEEAAAVAETRRSMETLLDSAQKIADRSSEVLGNAERSTNGSRQIADRIGNLNEISERIADILGSIMQVADKADLLALNASLEGTRAGDAGKGFALVGAEMRRLAENIIESVADIRELIKEMRELSQAAVSASEEGNDSSTATRHSAQKIAMLTQDQRKATEQVIQSMDELGGILNLTLDGIQRTSESANQLTRLATDLSIVVRPTPQPPQQEPAESSGSMLITQDNLGTFKETTA